MTKNRLVWLSGAAGLAMLIVGGFMYRRERQLGLLAGLGRGGDAPMIGSVTRGGMKTTLHSHPKMPIEMRIKKIQEMTHKSVQDPRMRKLALRITRHCPERDKVCEAKAVYNYVKENVRYTGDVGPIIHPNGEVEGIDLYQTAPRTLEFNGGDCDDQNIVVNSLLALNGHHVVSAVVKTRSAPDWEHIFPVDKIDGQDVAVDTTLPSNRSFGVMPKYHKRVDFPA